MLLPWVLGPSLVSNNMQFQDFSHACYCNNKSTHCHSVGALSRYQAGRMAAEFIASDPKKYGKLTGWHTAGINVAGSFLLGGISATPTVNVAKVNAQGAQPTRKAWQGLQGLSPRTKLMMGVG